MRTLQIFVTLAAFCFFTNVLAAQPMLNPDSLAKVVTGSNLNVYLNCINEAWGKDAERYEKWPATTLVANQSVADSVWLNDTSRAVKKLRQLKYARDREYNELYQVKQSARVYQLNSGSAIVQLNIFADESRQVKYMINYENLSSFKKYLSSSKIFKKKVNKNPEDVEVWEGKGVTFRLVSGDIFVYASRVEKNK